MNDHMRSGDYIPVILATLPRFPLLSVSSWQSWVLWLVLQKVASEGYPKVRNHGGAFSVITNLRMELFEALVLWHVTHDITPVLAWPRATCARDTTTCPRPLVNTDGSPSEEKWEDTCSCSIWRICKPFLRPLCCLHCSFVSNLSHFGA